MLVKVLSKPFFFFNCCNIFNFHYVWMNFFFFTQAILFLHAVIKEGKTYTISGKTPKSMWSLSIKVKCEVWTKRKKQWKLQKYIKRLMKVIGDYSALSNTCWPFNIC